MKAVAFQAKLHSLAMIRNQAYPMLAIDNSNGGQPPWTVWHAT